MHDQPHEAKPAAVGRERPHCYICGTIENLSKDHIPPKGFFPPNDYENFIPRRFVTVATPHLQTWMNKCACGLVLVLLPPQRMLSGFGRIR